MNIKRYPINQHFKFMNTKNIQNLIFDTPHVYLIFLFCVGLVHAQRVDVVDHLGNKAKTGTVVTENASAPNNPKVGDIWINTSKTPNTTNIYIGNDAWEEVKPSYQSVLQDTDADTKIQLEKTPNDNTIRFDTADKERMVITDEGKVGIGTSSPSTALGVAGTVTADGLTVGADGKIQFGTKDTAGIYRTNAGHDLTLRHWGNASVLIDSDNNDQDTRSFVIGNNSKDRSTAKSIAKFAEGGDISFYGNTGTTPKFFWDASEESLGIGTDIPTEKLEVNGNAKITGDIESSGVVTAKEFKYVDDSYFKHVWRKTINVTETDNPVFAFNVVGEGGASGISLTVQGTNLSVKATILTCFSKEEKQVLVRSISVHDIPNLKIKLVAPDRDTENYSVYLILKNHKTAGNFPCSVQVETHNNENINFTTSNNNEEPSVTYHCSWGLRDSWLTLW